LLIGPTPSGFIAGLLLVVFIITGPANNKEAYDKKDAGNQGEDDVHGSFKRV
jgi:hypothetical protein